MLTLINLSDFFYIFVYLDSTTGHSCLRTLHGAHYVVQAVIVIASPIIGILKCATMVIDKDQMIAAHVVRALVVLVATPVALLKSKSLTCQKLSVWIGR